MQALAIYRPNSDHARAVIEFKENVHRRYPDKEIEDLDIDTREGAEKAEYYAITQYPAILVMANNGSVLGIWQGLPLPLIDEVAGLMVEH